MPVSATKSYPAGVACISASASGDGESVGSNEGCVVDDKEDEGSDDAATPGATVGVDDGAMEVATGAWLVGGCSLGSVSGSPVGDLVGTGVVVKIVR